MDEKTELEALLPDLRTWTAEKTPLLEMIERLTLRHPFRGAELKVFPLPASGVLLYLGGGKFQIERRCSDQDWRVADQDDHL